MPDLATVIRALGSASFQTALDQFLNRIVPIDHCVVFTYADGEKPGHLFTDGRMDPVDAQALAKAYVERFHAQDPNAATILAGDEGHPVRFDAARADADYRRTFFDRTGLVDKASTVGRIEADRVYCNFYRMAETGPYSALDWERLEQVLPVATALISTHYRMVRHQRAGSLVHSLIGQARPPFDHLAPRERDVCQRILLGYTTLGIGLDLDIAPSSVITYRKRAYAKLGIASQNELFRLCLEAIHQR
jgi:DNA-binding CsgD family transcriptional regulator